MEIIFTEFIFAYSLAECHKKVATNINTVWKLENFLGLKMHCQNIVDGRCVQKEFFKNIFVK